MSYIKLRSNFMTYLPFLLLLILNIPHGSCGVTRDGVINAKQLSLVSQYAVFNPNMLLHSSGKIFLTYETGSNIYLGIFDSSYNTLVTPFMATTDNTFLQTGPRLVETSAGSVMMVWSSNHLDQGFNVYYKSFNSSGGEVIPLTPLTTFTTATATEQDITTLEGNIIIAYAYNIPNTTIDIKAAVLDSSGNATTYFISQNVGYYPTGIKLAASSSSIITVYVKLNGTLNLFAQTFNSQMLVKVMEFNVVNYIAPYIDVVVLKNDSFVIPWFDGTKARARLYGSSGNVIGDVLICSTECLYPRVASLSTAFLVTYQMLTNNQYYTSYFQPSNSGGQITSAMIVNSEIVPTGYYTAPMVISDSNNNIYIAYENKDGILAEKFQFKSTLLCNAKEFIVPQGSSNISITSLVSDELGSTVKYQLTSLPVAGTLKVGGIAAVISTDYNQDLYINIAVSVTTTFNYAASLNGNLSTPCTVTINSCAGVCATCSQIESTTMNCDTCKTGFYKTSDDNGKGNCYLQNFPPNGYGFNVNVFDPCYTSCKICTQVGTSTSNLCSTCADTYYPLEDQTSQCYLSSVTVAGYYYYNNKFLNINNMICYGSCYICVETGTAIQHKCIQCGTGYYPLVDDSTMCYLPSDTVVGYYFVTGSVSFSKCYSSCGSCITLGTDQNHLCSSCKPNYYQLEDYPSNCYMVLNVPTGYVLDSTINKFKLCYLSCSACQVLGTITQNQCTQCKTGYFPLQDNISMCYQSSQTIPGYYPNTNIFANCYSSCATCTTGGSLTGHNCTSCKASYYQLVDKTTDCYVSTNPPPNYYFDTSNNNFKRCYTSCSVCQETGTQAQHKCLGCTQGYFKLETDSSMCYQTSEIAKGYYLNNVMFSKCYNSCATCSTGGSASDHNCDQCGASYYPMEGKLTNCYLASDTLQGYFIDKTANIFKKCYLSCSDCNSLGDNINNRCNSCAYGYSKIDNQPSNCALSNVSTPGYYFDTSTGKFASCYSSCKTCNQKGDDSNHQCLVCKDSFYKPEDNTSNCFSPNKPVPSYYFDSVNKLFKHCYENCFTCSAAGDDNHHNCLTCKVDFFNPEDNNTQCYYITAPIQGYQFDNDIKKFTKCDEVCVQNEGFKQNLDKLSSTDSNSQDEAIKFLLLQPMSNDLITLVSEKLQIPETLNTALLENLNSLIEKYSNYIEKSDKDVSLRVFNVIDKVIDYTNNFITGGDHSDTPTAQYSKTKDSLSKLGDIVIAKNLDNPNLLISTKNFELDIFDYRKYNPEETLSWDSNRTSTVKITGCGDSIKQVSETDLLPIKKQDLKTSKLELNPYINNTKINVTDLITSRAIEITAYDPKTGEKLDIAKLCKGQPMGLSIQANEYTDFNATEYNSYKRLGIDIHDKNNFKECQSFSNNETRADFTTQFINNLTNVAIDCGAGCTFQNINNVKTANCSCLDTFKTEFNIYKQTLKFAIESTKIEVIKCIGTAFMNGPTIAANPSFWFIIGLIILSSSAIIASFYFHDFNRVFDQIVSIQTNFKPNKDNKAKNKIINDTQEIKQTDLDANQINLAIDVDDKNVQTVKESEANLNEKEGENQDIKLQSTDETVIEDDDYKKFLNIDINQGTAEYCTATELIQLDKRSYRQYLLHIFLTRHEIGKIFFFPNVYVPKFLTILYFVQVTSIKFAINAILYNDGLINQRNKLKDNVIINLTLVFN
jgi:hypothetical protein